MLAVLVTAPSTVQQPLLQQMSFIPCAETCHFPLENLPFGVFSRKEQTGKRLGVAIGEQVLDLAEVAKVGIFSGATASALQQVTLLSSVACERCP